VHQRGRDEMRQKVFPGLLGQIRLVLPPDHQRADNKEDLRSQRAPRATAGSQIRNSSRSWRRRSERAIRGVNMCERADSAPQALGAAGVRASRC